MCDTPGDHPPVGKVGNSEQAAQVSDDEEQYLWETKAHPGTGCAGSTRWQKSPGTQLIRPIPGHIRAEEPMLDSRRKYQQKANGQQQGTIDIHMGGFLSGIPMLGILRKPTGAVKFRNAVTVRLQVSRCILQYERVASCGRQILTAHHNC